MPGPKQIPCRHKEGHNPPRGTLQIPRGRPAGLPLLSGHRQCKAQRLQDRPEIHNLIPHDRTRQPASALARADGEEEDGEGGPAGYGDHNWGCAGSRGRCRAGDRCDEEVARAGRAGCLVAAFFVSFVIVPNCLNYLLSGGLNYELADRVLKY